MRFSFFLIIKFAPGFASLGVLRSFNRTPSVSIIKSTSLLEFTSSELCLILSLSLALIFALFVSFLPFKYERRLLFANCGVHYRRRLCARSCFRHFSLPSNPPSWYTHRNKRVSVRRVSPKEEPTRCFTEKSDDGSVFVRTRREIIWTRIIARICCNYRARKNRPYP